MMRRLLSAVLALAIPAIASAQQESTADALRRAIAMYNAFNIEGARPILQNIISPNYLLRVDPEERVLALKYLGASYAVLDKPDSAVTFFVAAIDFDPFTDLDPREFSAAEQNAFATAKERLFKVALRPIVPRIIDSTYAFQLITTQRANITVDLIDQTDTLLRKETLYQGDNNGLRQIGWQGLLRSGQRADSTTYEIRVIGRSLVGTGGQTTTDRQVFRIEHVYEPLEDTLPSIPQTELLQTEHPPSSPWLDLIKGVALGLVSASLPVATQLVFEGDAIGSEWLPHAAAAGAIGFGSAVIAFAYRRGHRTIPRNVQENNRRQQERARFNAEVQQRNARRIAATTLLICPATGCPR